MSASNGNFDPEVPPMPHERQPKPRRKMPWGYFLFALFFIVFIRYTMPEDAGRNPWVFPVFIAAVFAVLISAFIWICNLFFQLPWPRKLMNRMIRTLDQDDED